jgi:aryl-alcohol dehydrogenase-like predicted oxidoreductase
MLPSRYDMSIPGNQAKLAAAEKLADVAEQAGMPLIEMSLGFVLSHPAVSAAIIGPRTMEQLQSQLGALERDRLEDSVLDRIDEIVPPGTNVNPADTGWDPPWLTDPSLRRR